MGALGIKGVNNMSNRDLEDAIIQLRNNPDSMDDAQKAALLKKVRVNRSLGISYYFLIPTSGGTPIITRE